MSDTIMKRNPDWIERWVRDELCCGFDIYSVRMCEWDETRAYSFQRVVRSPEYIIDSLRRAAKAAGKHHGKAKAGAK